MHMYMYMHVYYMYMYMHVYIYMVPLFWLPLGHCSHQNECSSQPTMYMQNKNHRQ